FPGPPLDRQPTTSGRGLAGLGHPLALDPRAADAGVGRTGWRPGALPPDEGLFWRTSPRGPFDFGPHVRDRSMAADKLTGRLRLLRLCLTDRLAAGLALISYEAARADRPGVGTAGRVLPGPPPPARRSVAGRPGGG